MVNLLQFPIMKWELSIIFRVLILVGALIVILGVVIFG